MVASLHQGQASAERCSQRRRAQAEGGGAEQDEGEADEGGAVAQGDGRAADILAHGEERALHSTAEGAWEGTMLVE